MLLSSLICLVIGVSDGDTLTVRCQNHGQYEQLKIRLSGIDAPESKQPFGNRAKQALSDLCYRVEAKVQSRSRDRYQRTIADVQCKRMDAATHMVRTGMAWVYEKYDRGHEHLYAIQNQAKQKRIGLWSEPNPTPPWLWRQSQFKARQLKQAERQTP